MALSQNDMIIVNDFNELKSEIKTELDRRDQYSFSTWDNSANAVQNNVITDDIFNNLIKVLNTINEDTTNYDEVEVSKIIQQIFSLKTTNTLFSTKPYRDQYGTQSGCKAGCLGMCQSCTGTCEGTCDGCSGTCVGGCYGCGGDCTGSGCSGGCSGSCSWVCGSGCGDCTGCPGSCSGQCGPFG